MFRQNSIRTFTFPNRKMRGKLVKMQQHCLLQTSITCIINFIEELGKNVQKIYNGIYNGRMTNQIKVEDKLITSIINIHIFYKMIGIKILQSMKTDINKIMIQDI